MQLIVSFLDVSFMNAVQQQTGLRSSTVILDLYIWAQIDPIELIIVDSISRLYQERQIWHAPHQNLEMIELILFFFGIL